MSDKEYRACQACEFYKVYWFTHAVKAGVDTDIAREVAQAISTAWQAGYNYAIANERPKLKEQYGDTPED